MKRKISLVLLLVLLLSAVLTACGSGEKQIPVYRGMNFAPASASALSASGTGELTLLGADANKQQSPYSGDHTAGRVEIDQENPFAAENDDNLQYKLNLAFGIAKPSMDSRPNIDFSYTPSVDDYFQFFSVTCLAIHIDNPDNFEIVSCTVNEEEHTSDTYEKGSDGQTIYLKPTIRTLPNGNICITFTIDNIKYNDNGVIKDVIMGGDTTLSADDGQLTASVQDVSIGTSWLTMNVDVHNGLKGINLTKEELKAVVYDGKNIVATQDLYAEETNAVRFEWLKPGTLYQYLIVACYAEDKTAMPQVHVLDQYAFYTDAAVLFDNVRIGETSISFDFAWNEALQERSITALTLYADDAYVMDLAPDATTINELTAGTGYKLIATYLFAEETEQIYLEFTTPDSTPLTS